MTCLTFTLLTLVFGMLTISHLLNGYGKGSELARAVLSRLIDKLLPKKDPPSIPLKGDSHERLEID